MDLMIAFQAVGKEGDGDDREGRRHRHRGAEEAGDERSRSGLECMFIYIFFDGQVES